MMRGRPAVSEEEMRFRKACGKQLKAKMAELGISQAALAEELGITRPCVSGWVRGLRAPSLFRWWQMQKIFKEAG